MPGITSCSNASGGECVRVLVVQVGENGCHAYRYDVMSGFVLSHDKRFLTRAHSW